MMETLCQLIAAMRARVITDAQRNQMIRLLSLIGFTPADRSRITAVGKTDEADPFSKFVN
jgi:phage terminase small subunit